MRALAVLRDDEWRIRTSEQLDRSLVRTKMLLEGIVQFLLYDDYVIDESKRATFMRLDAELAPQLVEEFRRFCDAEGNIRGLTQAEMYGAWVVLGAVLELMMKLFLIIYQHEWEGTCLLQLKKLDCVELRYRGWANGSPFVKISRKRIDELMLSQMITFFRAIVLIPESDIDREVGGYLEMVRLERNGIHLGRRHGGLSVAELEGALKALEPLCSFVLQEIDRLDATKYVSWP